MEKALHFLEPFRIAQIFDRFPFPWGFCGGWAIDLFLDRPLRPHKDVDVAVLRRHQLPLQQLLTGEGWTLDVAFKGGLTPWTTGEFLELPRHGIWGRHDSFQPSFLEILLNEATDTSFLFRRNTSISLSLEQAFLPTQSGLPILAPEIVLLYKSGESERPENRSDMEAVLPALSHQQRQWLNEALTAFSPQHQWLAVIEGCN
jgi:hypothetical protein